MVQNPFNMTGYTKLFGSIVDSTIWRESKETKIVWITMLAKANRDGIVEASLPGLADASRVSIEECKESLKCLLSPDEYSRTKDFEGRRIEAIDGGWRILNHAKYRAKMNADERREYFRLKKQESRKYVKQMSTNVKHCPSLSNNVTNVTHAEAEAEAEAEAIYKAYPLKVGKPAALRAIRKAMKKISPSKLLNITEEFSKRRGSDLDFVPHPSTWFNQDRYNDDPSTWTKNETSKSNHPQRIDRSIGTANAGVAAQYSGLGKVVKT